MSNEAHKADDVIETVVLGHDAVHFPSKDRQHIIIRDPRLVGLVRPRATLGPSDAEIQAIAAAQALVRPVDAVPIQSRTNPTQRF